MEKQETKEAAVRMAYEREAEFWFGRYTNSGKFYARFEVAYADYRRSRTKLDLVKCLYAHTAVRMREEDLRVTKTPDLHMHMVRALEEARDVPSKELAMAVLYWESSGIYSNAINKVLQSEPTNIAQRRLWLGLVSHVRLTEPLYNRALGWIRELRKATSDRSMHASLDAQQAQLASRFRPTKLNYKLLYEACKRDLAMDPLPRRKALKQERIKLMKLLHETHGNHFHPDGTPKKPQPKTSMVGGLP